MILRVHIIIINLLIIIMLNSSVAIANSENKIVQRIRTTPQKDVGSIFIDGTDSEVGLLSAGDGFQGFDERELLERYGEVSMLDIKGADASKAILVIEIMTLHSFVEGSSVGVSFASTKGINQGFLVTLAIDVHNIPEGLAISMVLASRGVSPQNAML